MRRLAMQIRTLLWRGLPALAVYALVLEAFLAGAAPAATFDPDHAPLCSEAAVGAGVPAPAKPGGHDPGCVCVAACATPHAPLAMAPAASALLPHPSAQNVRQARGSNASAPDPMGLAGPSARGPPRG